MSYATSHNILIISDLHLGEDLKPASKSGYLRHVPMLERELESFLVHYRKYRRDGRPWELIINGDMVDFLSVCLFPEGKSSENEPEDHVWGLGTGPEAAKVKMLRVLERHPGVFRALARFIGAGNRVGIVVGNHDVEFHWPGVQETFRQGVARLWSELARAKLPGALSAEEIASGIAFHPWFYYRKNVVWVEHGHQYDTLCSFDHFLEPTEPGKEKVMLSLGAAAYRYVSNHVAGADPHQQEDWNAFGYVRFSFGLGLRGLVSMARGYYGFVARCLSLWRLLGRRESQPGIAARRDSHRRRLRELAEKFSLKEEILVALEKLQPRSVFTHLTRLVQAVMLDRVGLALLTSLLALISVVLLPSPWSLGAVAVLAAGAYSIGQALSRARGDTCPAENMRSVPQKIREHVSAPFVVFGHSHHPVALKLDGGGWYFNTGTWVATEKPGLLRSFTHLVIRDGADGPSASLCQWRDGKSLAFAPEARTF